MLSESEKEWIERRAREIAAECGEPLLIARSKAMAELSVIQEQPKAEVVDIGERRGRLAGKVPIRKSPNPY